jgi:hypothetical protein
MFERSRGWPAAVSRGGLTPISVQSAFGIRELIQIMNKRTQLCGFYTFLMAICETLQLAPIFSRAERIHHFEQSQFAFETYDTIEFRQEFELNVLDSGSVSNTERDTSRPVFLIGFQRQF